MKQKNFGKIGGFYHLRLAEYCTWQVIQKLPWGRSFLLTGKPGTGKTSFAEAVARELEVPKLFFQAYPGVCEDHLLFRPNLGRIVMKDIENASEAFLPGVLLEAISMSNDGKVVLIIDEIDKADASMDAFLLDFMENFRVSDAEGKNRIGNSENLLIFLTSNEERPLSDALMGRVDKVEIEFLSPQEEMNILLEDSKTLGYKPRKGLIRILLKLVSILREDSTNPPSLREVRRFLSNIEVAETKEMIDFFVRSSLVKNKEDQATIESSFSSVIWGELNK